MYIQTPEQGHEMPFLKGNRKRWPSFLLGGAPGRWEGEDSLKEMCWHAILWRSVFKAPSSQGWWCEREEGILTRTETAKYKTAVSHLTVSGIFLPSTLLDYTIFSRGTSKLTIWALLIVSLIYQMKNWDTSQFPTKTFTYNWKPGRRWRRKGGKYLQKLALV